jgi:hypothetical protein
MEKVKYKRWKEYRELDGIDVEEGSFYTKALLVETPHPDRNETGEHTYHLLQHGRNYLSNTLAQFLCAQGLEFKAEDPQYWSMGPGECATEPEGEGYKVLGAGRLEYDGEQRKATFCNGSGTYQPYDFKQKHLPILEKILGVHCALR